MLRRLARACATRSSLLASRPSSSSSSSSSSSVRASAPWAPRFVSTSAARAHGAAKAREDEDTIEVTFVDREGERRVVRGRVGDNLLETAHANDVELEGACEGSLACSTCHVVFDSEDVFASLPEACDDENDMLDLAYGLTDRSRLGCQVTLAPGKLDGCVVTLPRATRNFAVDGFKPKPH